MGALEADASKEVDPDQVLASREMEASEEGAVALNRVEEDAAVTVDSVVEGPEERAEEILAEEEAADASDATATPRVLLRKARITLPLMRTCFSTGTRPVLKISVSHFSKKLLLLSPTKYLNKFF